MRISSDIKLDFDDVLLVPQRSSLDSRADVQLERTYKFRHTNKTWTGIGIIAANMDSIGTFAMAKELAKHKMLTALHKHYSVDDLVDFFFENQDIWNNVFYTIGINQEDLIKLSKVSTKLFLRQRGIDYSEGETITVEIREEIKKSKIEKFPYMINLDVANGYTKNLIEHLRLIRKMLPDSIIMAGNVVTGNMTEELILSGADIIKIGIGGGSTCLTRIVTGCGVPQISAIDACAFQSHGLNGHVCSDGGIRTPGDASKVFAVGADFAMLGGMLSGTDECEGEWEGDFFKFHGMSSKEAMEKHNGGLNSYRSAEGKEVLIPRKGPVKNIIQDICGGIRSCCTYSGALRLKDLPKCAEFIRVNSTHNKIYENNDNMSKNQ